MIPYIIKTFRGGISDESDKGTAGSFKHGYGLDIHSRDDVLKCASTVTTIDESTITDLVEFFVPAPDGTTYAFGSTGSIYAISGNIADPAVNFVYNDENGRIRGAAHWKFSDGNNYMFWATATSVARVLMNGSLPVPWGGGVATQDYKTILDSAEYHTMKPSSGDLMIANGNYLAKIDYDGNFTPSALNIRPGNLIKTLEERDDFTILGSERLDDSEEGHLWSWIITASNYIQKKRIPIKGVNALISTELMLLQGGNAGELFFSDFINAVPLIAVPGGGQVNPGGVTVDNDLALFGFYGGVNTGLWSYGRRMKNRPHALNFQYRLAKTAGGSSVSTIGAVAVVNGLALASWGTTDGSTSDYGVDMVSSTTVATAKYEGLEFDAGSPHLKKMVDTVKVVTDPLQSGGALQFDGIDDFVSYPTGVTTPINGSTNFTHSAWFNLTAVPTVNPGYISGWYGGNFKGQSFYIATDGHLRSTTGLDGAANNSDVDLGLVTLNTWYNVAIVFNGATLKSYVNGVEVSSVTQATVDNGTSQAYVSGRSGWDANYGFLTGQVDDIRLYSTNLSAAQILAIYNNSNPTTTSLIAHYKFDEWTGTTAYDSSASLLNGTIIGPTFVNGYITGAVALSLIYKLQRESSWKYAVMGSGATSFSVSGETEAIFSIGGVGSIYEVGVELTPYLWNTAKVHAIISYLSNETYDY